MIEYYVIINDNMRKKDILKIISWNNLDLIQRYFRTLILIIISILDKSSISWYKYIIIREFIYNKIMIISISFSIKSTFTNWIIIIENM